MWTRCFGFGAQYRFGRVAVRAGLEALLSGFDDDDDEADGDDWAQMYSIGVASSSDAPPEYARRAVYTSAQPATLHVLFRWTRHLVSR
jgi:hypothetical protein